MARYSNSSFIPTNSSAKARGEHGQVLILFALLIPVLLGMAALAIDLGSYSAHRRSLQNSADAIALAAAQELPDEAAAEAKALEWAAKYDLDAGDLTIETSAASVGDPNPSVRVTIERPHAFHFMRALQINEADVSAAAKAIKTSPGGSGNVLPWAILEKTKDESDPGDLVVLKYDSNNVSQGNFGAIRLDGNGASTYGDTIIDGSSSVICAAGVTGCAETSPVCDGATCQTETGNMVGKTKNGVDYRMDNTAAECDSFDEVFTLNAEGRYDLDAQCNPWVDGGYASLRVIVVPIIDSLCNGSCDVTVTGFTMFWLEGYGSSKCSGNSCEIEGRFIDAELTTGALTGAFDEDSSLHFARLVE